MGVDGDVVAELVELVDQPTGVPGLGVWVEPFDEVLGAEVVVCDVTAEHDPYSDENACPTATRARGLPPSTDDTSVAGGQVGALGAGGCEGDLSHHGLEPGVAVAGAARACWPPGLVVARANAGPRRRRWETGSDQRRPRRG